MTDREYLVSCEVYYENELKKIVEEIRGNKAIKLVMIAGPSCAGKTTTTAKLNKKLSAGDKINTFMLSLDDFYKNPAYAPLDDEGKPDLESVNSLDLDYLHDCLHNISIGKSAYIPTFDFNKRDRTDTYRKIRLEENDICFIEGLHALNPELYSEYVENKAMYRIFLDPRPYDSYPFSPSDVRKIRRLVRDYYHRSANAEKTFSMWPSVRNGEKKYIYPFSDLADVNINTFFEYEASVLKEEAIEILSELHPDSEYYDESLGIIEKLMRYRAINPSQIPEGSLMNEFVQTR
ncbi:MAG: nucleoside kinase [Eubacteriales bacterium]|nr:nucleoside kinase [Eubacteriales bacterium]MDD4475091.1 nucleoside kinase [Eubacteriales bacterium]